MKAIPTMPRPTTHAFFLVLETSESSGVVALVEPEAELVGPDAVQPAVSVGTGAITLTLQKVAFCSLQ